MIDKAEQRSAALNSISETLDLGSGLTVQAYQGKIDGTREKLENYNNLLASADAALVELEQSETELADWTERMLKGVASRYGRNSEEYAKAGGTRKDDIRYPSRKPVTAPPTKLAA